MKKKPSHRDAINKLADEAADRVRAAGFTHKRFRNACVRAMVNAAVEQCSNKRVFVRAWRSILAVETSKGIAEAKEKNARATLARYEASKKPASNSPPMLIEGGQ